MLRILSNAGHGPGRAHNRGSVCSNEGDNNFYYSLAFKKEMETYEGVQVDLVRNKIRDNPHIYTRAAMGEGYDLYISHHSNGFHRSDVRGTEVFDSIERPNKELAQAMVDATAKFFNHNNRGVKYKEGQKGYNYFGEMRFNRAKSVILVENGFHTNATDCNIYKNKHQALAEVQCKVIADHYGLKKKASNSKPPAKASKTISQMAMEVIAGKHGTGHENKAKKTIDQMANEILKGIHGNGHANRRKSLGISEAEYEKVRKRVNQLV